MLKEAIYHRPKNQFAYSCHDGTVQIMLRTKHLDLNSVTLFYGDPFQFVDNRWVKTSVSMKVSGHDELFDYWLVRIKPPQKRLRYAFELIHNEEKLFFTEKGFCDFVHDDFSAYFCFPFYHKSDSFTAPNWVKETVWYQIFPDRFSNGTTTNDPATTLPWNSTEPTVTTIFGGDLKGVLKKLDYLVDLGITGIYFTPIFKANSNHKYDTIDYFEIDPQFGDKQTFKKLVEECHKKGIRIMLDAVFNHCGKNFPPFQDAILNRNASPYKDWFHFTENQIKEHHYETFSFEKSMPKLNTTNPEVKQYLIDVGQYWIKEFNIDGWRLDVANEVDHQFWREFRQAVKSVKKDVFLVGEVWHDALPWLEGEQFDSVMNYPLTNMLHRFFAYDEINAKQFEYELQSYMHQYPKPQYEMLFNIIGSHDTPRIINIAQMNKKRVKLIKAFQFSFLGTPSIYYGDEIGLTGDQDPGCRKCMVWEEDNQDQEMLTFMKKLIHLRKKYPIMANEGDFKLLAADANKNYLCYSRETKNQLLLVVMNKSAEKQSISLPIDIKNKTILDLWKSEEFAANSSSIDVILEPYDFSFLLVRR